MEHSILAQLPPEIQIEVLDRLQFKDLLSCSSVCRHVAILSNELIVKKGSLKIKFPFPPRQIYSNLLRSYMCLTLTDQHFLSEPDKLEGILCSLTESKTVKIKEIKLHMLEEVESLDKIPQFFEFLTCNPQIQTIFLTSYFELTLNELIGKMKSILPHAAVNILKAFDNDDNTDFIVPSELQNLEVFSEMTEIQLLTTLKTYPKLRSLIYCLKNDKNPKDVIQAMQRLELSKVPLKELSLTAIECLDVETPSLSVFQSLKKLTLHFREDEIFPMDEDDNNESSDKFKFIQSLYSNNCRTLRSLKIEISGSKHIYNLLPSKDINLVLEHMIFDNGFSDGKFEEDSLKFVKLFVNQQLPNLRSLYIEKLEIDDEMINLLTEAEHLENLSLITCDIHFETIWPCFTNLKRLDLTDSTITYCSLQGFLGNYRIQNSLESLSLERIHPKRGRKKQLKVTNPYGFQKLKKLNLLNCNMRVDFLSKFLAPELERLNYDYHNENLPLLPVLQYPDLKVLCLGVYRNVDVISSIITKRNKLEIIEIGVDSDLLITLIKYLLVYGGNIKFAKIVCIGLFEVIDSLEISFKENIHNYPGYSVEFRKDQEKFIKFSSQTTTIIVHSYEQAYRGEHSTFYENFMFSMWDCPEGAFLCSFH